MGTFRSCGTLNGSTEFEDRANTLSEASSLAERVRALPCAVGKPDGPAPKFGSGNGNE
jgi:hypothetical protein